MPSRRSVVIASSTGVALAVVLFAWLARPRTVPVVAHPAVHLVLERTLLGATAEVWDVAFSPDGAVLASASVDGSVRLWRLAGDDAQTLVHPAGVTSLAFSPDGSHLATGSYDGLVRIWDPRAGVVERTLAGHTGTVWTVAFAPDGRKLASGGEDKTVRVWSVDDGAELGALSGHALNVWSVAFSPDGRLLASGSFDRTARLWSAETGELLRTLSGHEQAIVALAFRPDSRSLATGSDDASVKVWRTDDGALLTTLTGGSEHVYAVAFSPDGRWLASGSRERGAIGTPWKQNAPAMLRGRRGLNVRLWEVRDGTLQQAISARAGDVHSVAFHPDGSLLATSGEEPVVEVWRIETDVRGRTSPP